MSGSNRVPVPSEHPNNDLLADLAAQVLPDDLARQVQDHVVGCGRCAAVLSDAESVRVMLLQIEPVQMPDDVLVRLERAILIARREDQAGPRTGAADDGETRILGRVPPLASDSGRTDPGRRIARAGNPAAPGTGRIAQSAALTGSIASAGPKTSRLNRMTAPAQSARRQAIEEQKADQPSRFSRLAPMLRIAAAVLVVVGAGAGALQVVRGGNEASDSAGVEAADTKAAAPIIAPVQSTKTNYAKKALPTQVKSLIANSQKLLVAPNSQAQVEAEGSDETSVAGASPSAANRSAPAPAASGLPQGQLLRSPEALRACLTAIGAGDAQPVAVDLAEYAGREAAIIVLSADGGGYEVWVVARDCRKGSDGAIDVVTVKS